MSQETVVDPRSKISHPVDEGQVYEDARNGDELVLVFLSDDAALLRDETDDTHRLETREMFDKHVGSGRYSLHGSTDASAASSKVQKIESLIGRYEAKDGRTAAHKVEALEEALLLIENNGRPDDNETVDFESIDGIGDASAQALRANGFTTKGDVRSADESDLKDVRGMGEKNTQNLIEHVNDE